MRSGQSRDSAGPPLLVFLRLNVTGKMDCVNGYFKRFPSPSVAAEAVALLGSLKLKPGSDF